jgi:hypothetical protein
LQRSFGRECRTRLLAKDNTMQIGKKHTPRKKSSLRPRLALVLACAAVLVAISAEAQTDRYRNATAGGTAFGSRIGAGTEWRPAYAQPRAAGDIDFGGKATLSCSGIDFQAFLAQFKSAELVNQLKDTILSGAQSTATMYLLTLAYSNPTIASVLDMMDTRLSARFSAFAQACDSMEAKRRGEQQGARAMGEAGNQCFDKLVSGGASPTEAYRQCARQNTVGGMDLPSNKDMNEFLTKYTNIDVTAEMDKLLGMVSNTRVTTAGVEMRPPKVPVTVAKANVEDRTMNAVRAILNGTDPNNVSTCTAGSIESAPSGPSDACIPPGAAAYIRSPAFLAARQLPSSEQDLYAAAISEQAAAVDIRARIVELRQKLREMAPRPGADVSAEEAMRRKEQMERDLANLQGEADALEGVAIAKAQLLRTQMLAQQRVQQQLSARADADNAIREPDRTGFSGTMRTIFGL